MNVAAGFDTGFAFYYAANDPGTISVYSGLNETGSVLATLSLPTTPDAYYQWSPIGVSFAGIAHSVDFGGSANYVAFDNITLGAATPIGAVPEVATWLMMILGFGLVGGVMRSAYGKSEDKFTSKVRSLATT